MSKKKSYMNRKNILSEGALKDFLLGLFKGKKRINRDVQKLKYKIDKSVKDYNDSTDKLEKALYKIYGKKVKFPKQTADDVINKAR